MPPNQLHKKQKKKNIPQKKRKNHKKRPRPGGGDGYARGHLLKALHNEGSFDVEGIDFGEATFRYLKSLGLNVSLASVEDKNYPAAYFDVVVGLHVLEHVQDPFKFIAEVHRILGPGGRLYLQVPTVAHWRARRAGKAWRALTPPVSSLVFRAEDDSPVPVQARLSSHLRALPVASHAPDGGRRKGLKRRTALLQLSEIAAQNQAGWIMV